MKAKEHHILNAFSIVVICVVAGCGISVSVPDVGEPNDVPPVEPTLVPDVGEPNDVPPVEPTLVPDVGEPNDVPPVEPALVPDVGEPNDVPPVEPTPVPDVGEPNNVPPIEPPAPPAASEVGLQRTAWDIGAEVYYFKYEEPGLMEDEGVFYGGRLGYTFRDSVPSSPKESPSDRGAMFRVEGRLVSGQVDYDGSLSDGTPYTIDSIRDFVFEGRLLLGADMLHGDTLNTLYTGIGYRYLKDDSSFDPSGYERQSNYLYVPLGYQFDGSRKAGWSFGFNAEFDFLVVGYQRSHLSDISPAFDDVENRQESGYGYRASVRFQHKSENAIFVIEPFFRYWDIGKSEVAFDREGWLWLEPANETTEVGIQLFLMF